MQKRAVLWDMDGTLVDSRQYHWEAWRDTFAKRGIHITYEQFLGTFGQRNDVIIPQMLGRQPSAEELKEIDLEKEERYRQLVREKGLKPLPGAAEWVRKLHEEGWLQAIASSAPRANVEVVLEVTGLQPYFQAIVSAEDVRHGKPDPEVFLVAAKRLAVDPSHCIVVEDAPAGIEAARRAGMKAIGIASEDRPLEADLVVYSLKDLPEDAFEKLLAAGATYQRH